jgi:hypothetical protein
MCQDLKMIRLECCSELADKLALEWHRSFSDFEGYYCTIPVSSLRFIVTNVKQGSKFNVPMSSIIGRRCIFIGTCSFVDVSNAIVRVVTWKSGETDYGVEFSFFSSIDNTVLGRVFFYLETGILKYIYNPYIVNIQSQNDHTHTVMDILTHCKKNAVFTIECAFLRAKFQPNYALCKKLLLQDLKALGL